VLRKIAKINGNNMEIQVSDFLTPANITNSHSSTTSSEVQYPKIEFISNPISYIKCKISLNLGTVKSLFIKELFATTILLWCIWTLVSFAHTMFNAFLPKYLESLSLSDRRKDTYNDSLMQNVLKDYIIYSLCGIPGNLVGSWLIETFLGRIGTMSIAAFGTALAVFLFSAVKSHYSKVLSSAMVNFLSTLIYAVTYGYTPEVFESKVRGTACGIASAFGKA
jgi:MFS family permease